MMNKENKHSKQITIAILAGLLVGLISMGLVTRSVWAAPQAAPHSQETVTATPKPKDCVSCHPDVGDAWTNSPHAHSYDSVEFTERWKSLGEPGECLLCHTTGYQATTGEYSVASVTCEACHGAPLEGHPPAVMPIRSDADYCGTCHTITLAEWRLTGHAAADVGCTDCHNPHSQKARFEDTDEMCVNCHKDDLGEHQNDTHIQKGIHCVECHALVIPPEMPPADGLVPTGHSFTITSATCVACHTDTLHIGQPVPGYETGAKAVAASLPVSSTLPTLVADYTGAGQESGITQEQHIQALEATLASTRLSTLFQGGLIGLALGGTTAYVVARNLRQNADEEAEEDVNEDGTSQPEEEALHE
jgi:predicted CXXCH cytochrome family protein